MGKITVEIDDELEKQLRHLIIDVYGTRKGALKIAVEEALKMWIEKKRKEINTRIP